MIGPLRLGWAGFAAALYFVSLAPSLAAPQGQSASYQNIPFVGAGGRTATSLTNRVTHKGAIFDMRADFGAACDGTTDDTAKFSAMIAALGSSTNPVTVTFPGACVVSVNNYTISGNVSFKGLSGGGITLPTSSDLLATPYIKWTGAYTIYINDFVLNLNHASIASGIASGVGIWPNASVVMANSQIINGGAIASGASFMLLFPNNALMVHIFNSLFSMDSVSSEGNQCINVGGASDLIITGNTCINTAIGAFSLAIGSKAVISNNLVDGWGFGGGITYEINGATDASVHDTAIANNVVRNSAAAPDHLGTWLDGLEIGYNGVVITGNRVYNTCGNGIALYGRSQVIGNTVGNPGLCNHNAFYNSGIAALNPPYNPVGANYSYIVNNTVFDDGGGNTSYGFSDNVSSVGIVLGQNNFTGSLGSTHLIGLTSKSSGGAESPMTVVSTTSYIVGSDDTTLLFSSSLAANATVTLPTPSIATIGRTITVLNQSSSYSVSSASANVTPLAGGSPSTAIVPAGAGKFIVLNGTATGWYIVQGN